MNWNPETLPPAARQQMLAIGRAFTTTQTVGQAEHTLRAYATHKAILTEYGFSPTMGDALQNLFNMVKSADAVKLTAKAGGKNTAFALRTATKVAKKARKRAVGVLRPVISILETIGTEEAIAAASEVRAKVEKVIPVGDNVVALETQLVVLHGAFDNPVVAETAKDLGGQATVAALANAKADLAAKSAAHKKGVPVHNEQEFLDVVDGLIATLCRHARSAARAAASDLEQPGLAKDFELIPLYAY